MTVPKEAIAATGQATDLQPGSKQQAPLAGREKLRPRRDKRDPASPQAKDRAVGGQLGPLLGALPLIIAYFDRDERHLRVSKGYCDWLGCSTEAVEGKTISQVLPAQAYAVLQPFVQRALGGESVTFCADIELEPGDSRFLEATYIPELDAQGRCVGFNGVLQDRTEERQKERALRESEQRFRDFADVASHWLWEMGPDLRFTYLSDGITGLTGERPADFVGKTRGEIAGPEPADLQALAENLAAMERREAFTDFVFRRPSLCGGWLTLSLSGKPIFGDDGRFVGYRGSARDITERVEIEEALRASEARLRAIFEHSPVEIYVKDREGRYTLASVRSKALFGGGKSVVGKTAHDLFPQDQASLVEAIDRQVMDTGQPVESEVELTTKGQSRTYLLVKFPILDADGRCTAVGAVSTDITARKGAEEELRAAHQDLERRVERRTAALRAANAALQEEIAKHIETETALRENRSLLEAVFDATPIRIDVRDARSRFLFMNRHQAEVLLVEPEEAIGQTPVELLGAEVGEYEMLQDLKTIELHRPLPHYEEEIPDASGGVRTWLTSKVPIVGENNEIRHIVTTSLDVTDLKAREHELKQSQRMDAIGKLTGGIAHDFNNLLFVIGGNLQLLEDELTQDSEIQEKLLAIKKSAKIGTDLTRSLLAFSRQTPLSPISVDISETVGGTVRVLLRTLSDDIYVDTAFAEDAWPVLVDPSQLENAILNLAVNARDAMPLGGQLRISTRNVTVPGDRSRKRGGKISPGDYVVVSVSDSGHGMPHDVAERAFEPFFTTKESGAGTGLGLSMVYGFVHQSGGHVEIDSRPGAGTTIEMYLPRAPSSQTYDLAVDLEKSRALTKGVKILVAEDDDDVRRVAVKMLERMGYRTVAAEDGKQAIEILEADPSIDLLFTDVVMPGGLNGRQLAQAATAIRPDLKVLYASGYARSIIVEGGKIEEGVQILSKPYGPDELGRAIRIALDAGEAA